jgi:serine/threonine protein kinase
MSIQPGQNLLHYRIVEKVGEGGMGVVWKALDTSLERAVAIKVLPEAFAADQERLLRFEREAKLLASLNHPNIAAVYGLHEAGRPSGPVRFIVMELVEGEDLAVRLKRGPLDVDDALAVAIQAADGFTVAHDQGVIHRALKPGNVVCTPDGKVKILDFGLAKAFAADSASGSNSLSMSPTVTSAGTLAGTLLGTAAYMSPEQARGKLVDKRTDVWAFGCLLYEMLTARQAFSGETITDVLAAIVHREPDWNLLPAQTPPVVRRVLQRCTRKELETRARRGVDRLCGDPGRRFGREYRCEPRRDLRYGPADRSSGSSGVTFPLTRRHATALRFGSGRTTGRLPVTGRRREPGQLDRRLRRR